jgi:branched-chain amino acid aminotransferase
MIINLNGQIVPKGDAKISIFDHGFLYGASIYETFRTYGGKPFLLNQHLARLEHSAQGLQLKLPLTLEQLKLEILKTLNAASYPEAVIRLIVTRGEGGIGYASELCGTPAYIVLIYTLEPPAKELYERGVEVAIVSARRNLPESLDPTVKSGNLLNQMLAWNEAHSRDAYEALLLNYRGELTEGTMCNIFLVKNQILKTPASECGILLGLTRQLVLEIAHESDLKAEETILSSTDLFQADEAFLTVTSREIIPVVRCDRREIGSGFPGTMTRFLHLKYRQKVKELMMRERDFVPNYRDSQDKYSNI